MGGQKAQQRGGRLQPRGVGGGGRTTDDGAGGDGGDPVERREFRQGASFGETEQDRRGQK